MLVRILTVTVLLASVFVCSSCGASGDSECRLYIVEGSGGSIDGLYVVDSPANDNWGTNLLNGPAEYLEEYPTWRVFRFEAGRTLDHKLDYHDHWGAGSTGGENGKCRHGEGIKYELNDYLFTTTFNFD
jgi:hypothetical protein